MPYHLYDWVPLSDDSLDTEDDLKRYVRSLGKNVGSLRTSTELLGTLYENIEKRSDIWSQNSQEALDIGRSLRDDIFGVPGRDGDTGAIGRIAGQVNSLQKTIRNFGISLVLLFFGAVVTGIVDLIVQISHK